MANRGNNTLADKVDLVNKSFRISPDKFGFSLPYGRGSSTLGGRGTETLKIAMKFGMPVIGQEENSVSIDELGQRKVFFTP